MFEIAEGIGWLVDIRNWYHDIWEQVRRERDKVLGIESEEEQRERERAENLALVEDLAGPVDWQEHLLGGVVPVEQGMEFFTEAGADEILDAVPSAVAAEMEFFTLADIAAMNAQAAIDAQIEANNQAIADATESHNIQSQLLDATLETNDRLEQLIINMEYENR